MNLPFFYIESLSSDMQTYVLSEDTSKHIIQVLRMKIGECIQLTDGKGNLVTAEIIDDHKKKCVVKKVDFTFLPIQNKKAAIAISLVKNSSRFEWFLEKATEIGVQTIYPIICNRTEKQHFRKERLQTIIISAMLQSKQVWMPDLAEVISFQDFINTNQSEVKYIAHCEEDGEKNTIEKNNNDYSSVILIGPEGDFTKDEIESAKAKNFKPVSLGTNRLRTETAGVVAVTLLNN